MRVDPAVFIFLEDGTGFFVYSRARKLDVLLQIADAVIFGDVDVSAVDVFVFKDHLEQRGFATSVSADDADALTGSDQKTGIVKKFLGAERFADVLNLYHADKSKNS